MNREVDRKRIEAFLRDTALRPYNDRSQLGYRQGKNMVPGPTSCLRGVVKGKSRENPSAGKTAAERRLPAHRQHQMCNLDFFVS